MKGDVDMSITCMFCNTIFETRRKFKSHPCQRQFRIVAREEKVARISNTSARPLLEDLEEGGHFDFVPQD